MLVSIVLSLLWAVCSTVLIQPWFWKGLIKRKTLIGDNQNRGWIDTKQQFRGSIIMQIVFGCFTLIVSLLCYLLLDFTCNFQLSVLPIICVLVFQAISIWDGWNNKQGKKTLVIAAIAVIFLFFAITDAVTSDFEVEGLSEPQEIPISISIAEDEGKEQKVLSSSIIESLFKAESSSGPLYSNGKFVYTVTKTPNGDGIVVVDENDGKIANFIACEFDFEVSFSLRQKYPYTRIKEMNIVISDDNVPFGKFAVLNKTKLFSAPVLDKYILQNMITGDIIEYTPQTLPQFAK